MYSNKLLNQLLSKFNVGYEQIDDFFFALLDDVQGWAALFCDYEQKGKGVCLQDLLTLRLIIFDALGMNSCYKFQSKLIPASDAVSDTCLMFDLLCSLELEPNGINEFIDYLPSIFNVVSPFFDVDRRCQVLHQAYELSYYSKVASAIIKKKEDAKERDQTFAAIFCIDDREESLRRHLEEVDSKCSTYGYAGFFNIEMLFKSSRLKHAVALCPVSIKPTRVIEEKIISENSFKKSIFKYFETLRRLMYVKSKSAFFGAVLHFSLLIFTVLGDLMRFLSPQVYSFFVKKLRKSVQTGFMTDLEIKRSENLSIDAFSDEEIADKISLLLRTIGLVENFPKIIFIIGHGSTSLNNPHESAYDCGACSGQRGGPNARVFAKLANEKGVRKALANKGIELQPETIFVGGYHDTSSDKIEFFDLEKIPKSLTVTFEQYIATFYQASKLDAHERSRRFHSIPFGTPGFALKKVEARSLKYAQPRPECGHATNALCIIGSREITKNIFLDRRAFLCSYDSKSDQNRDLLIKLLSAVVPVCSGINLEYYFSYIDNDVFGCGTKLPHNISSLVGVINGHLSDLQTGLPWQMVEIHEPVRLLIILEISLKELNALREKLPAIFSVVDKGWFHFAAFDTTNKTVKYLDGSNVNICEYTPPTKKNSVAYYECLRSHLDPCYIGVV